MNETSPSQNSKSPLMARFFAILLLGIGVLALGSAMLQFLLPLAVVAALGSLAVMAIRGRAQDRQAQIGQKICKVSLDTVSEATRITGKAFRLAVETGKTFHRTLKS
jgi:hypothetical protein